MPLVVVEPDPAWPTVTRPDSPAATAGPADNLRAEVERQARVYAELGVARLAGLDGDALAAVVERLLTTLDAATTAPPGPATAGTSTPAADPIAGPGLPDDHAPVLLVLPVDVNALAPAMRRAGRTGVSTIDPDEAATYRPIDGVDVPEGPYLVAGVDSGSRFTGTTPETALAAIRAEDRTPLTLAEAVALAVVRPDLLRPGRCWSAAGSRAANQRVPAVWISQRRAKLGWCWDRNPHDWLGVASAAARVAGA